jgi:hypothetical protein
MSARRRGRRGHGLGELRFEITDADVLGSLAYPGPPPGQWRVPVARGPHTDHIDALLEALERALWVQN